MQSLKTIKRLELEAQKAYIHDLYTTLPKEPITTLEFELERAILQNIRDAERELSEITNLDT